MLTALSNKDINQMNETSQLISSLELANPIFSIFNPKDCFMKIIKEYDAKIEHLTISLSYLYFLYNPKILIYILFYLLFHLQNQ